MNKKYIFSALACIAAVAFTGCIEENFEKITPAQDGDEIIFGVRAGFEDSNPSTRTVYSGETYTVGEKTFERIEWVDGTDMIEIHSPEAANGSTAHYTINHLKDADQQKDYAYLTRIGDSSLQWNGDGQHNFYAMYPSSKMFTSESTLAQGVKMEGTKLRGTIPAAQAPVSIEKNGTNWTATPDMKYAYMAAKGTATREDGSVSLTFVPVVTAVQIQLTLDASSTGSVVKPLEIAEVAVQGVGIAGDFSADLSSWNGTYPTCQNVGTGGDNIMVSLWKDGKPITVNPGESLTFTVFLRPGQNYENLHVAISPNGAAYKGKKMELPIPANLKTRISNFRLHVSTEDIVFDASNWMAQIAPETKLMKLSIPGSGGSFSYNYNSSNPSWYKQQTLTFDQQWAAGIRAFEIVSDRPTSANTTLGTQNVKCNKVSMGVTVLEVLEDLLDKVSIVDEGESEPSECAVLILTYQPEGVAGNSRNGASYASSLKLMYDGLEADQKSQIIQYTPDLTLAKARGKVMIFCRINQKDETDNGDTQDENGKLVRAFDLATETLKNTNITLIDGCGTGKDRWGSRGYTVKGTDESGNVVWNVAYDAANITDATKSVDYYLRKPYNDSFADWNNVTKPSTENLNFGFETNFDDVTCWYQEWARVVPASLIDSSLGYFYGDIEASWIDWFPTDYRWYESYTEKVAAATTTFNMAISDKYPSYVFINSLCGYFVDPSIESSYTIFTGSNTGGIAGNIEALANEINPDFYTHVLEAADEQTTGPTGIVMMDYVKNVASGDDDGGYYLPGVIIANNRKFGTGNSSSSGSNGGGNTDTNNPGSDNEGGEEGM